MNKVINNSMFFSCFFFCQPSFNTPPLHFPSHDSFHFIFHVELIRPTQLLQSQKYSLLILDANFVIYLFCNQHRPILFPSPFHSTFSRATMFDLVATLEINVCAHVRMSFTQESMRFNSQHRWHLCTEKQDELGAKAKWNCGWKSKYLFTITNTKLQFESDKRYSALILFHHFSHYAPVRCVNCHFLWECDTSSLTSSRWEEVSPPI